MVTRLIRLSAPFLSLLVAFGFTAVRAAAQPTPTGPGGSTAPIGPPVPICIVDPERELLIRDLSVVEECLRTTWGPCSVPDDPAARGAWTFGKLIEGVAGTTDPAALSDFVLKWLGQWEADQTVNGFTVPERSDEIKALVIDPWLAASGGTAQLDMKKAPFRLLAIVNRVDLRVQPTYGGGNAGEARFVFGVLNLNNAFDVPPFTVIFEYGIPASSCTAIKLWARRWHRLGSIPFGPMFNKELQSITDTFTKINANPAKPNGSAINQVRTNEIALTGPWELREFTLQPDPSGDTPIVPLREATVKQTPNHPDFFNRPELAVQDKMGTQHVASFINEFEAEILGGTHVVPEVYQGRRFLGGSTINNIDFWNDFNSPPINSNEARHRFSLNTCNGCHGAETSTGFLQIEPRPPGQVSGLSGFLTGIDVFDPIDGTLRHFDDLERREDDLCKLLTQPCSVLEDEVPTNRPH